MPANSEPGGNQINEVLTAPLCREVVRFLLEHPNAMDTVDGIAAWWAHCDPIAAQAAIDGLIRAGVVECHTFSGRAMYRLTRDPRLRAWLAAHTSLSQQTGLKAERTTR
jgi:hypothetical protein